MKSIKEHREKVKEIADLAFANAVNNMDLSSMVNSHPSSWDKDLYKKFIEKVHEGFKTAQNLLIEEIQYYQTLLRNTIQELKQFRRDRDKKSEEITKSNIAIIKQRLSTFHHIADSIAWQLIGGEIHIARRFHIGEQESKNLDSSNIKHAISVVNQINKNPLDFALISDLTNFVQIGDVIAKSNGRIGIMELKEGSVNEQISDFFEQMKKDDKEITEDVLKAEFDDKTIKQVKRMQRQMMRADRATEVIKNDEGIDPVSGGKITVSTPTIPTEGYHQEILALKDKLDTKIWAYTVIEKCLHLGMYRDKGILMAGVAIEATIKRETENYIMMDWLSITDNLSQPIFAKPFDPEFILDILTGKIKIILGLNLDRLIEVFNELGIETKWLTTKETAKIKKLQTRKDMVVVNNRGISMKVPHLKESEMILGGGIISKILFDNINPSNIALTLLTLNPTME